MTTYERAWYAGERSGALERTIDGFKFERAKDAAIELAILLDAVLPALPDNVIVVPVPTVAKHVRQRGYDHTALLARRLAKLRSLPYQRPLDRADGASVQLGATKPQRMYQAEHAFRCSRQLNPSSIYLLVDDVVTTNATVRYAAGALRTAGAQTVWVATLARQSLDKAT